MGQYLAMITNLCNNNDCTIRSKCCGDNEFEIETHHTEDHQEVKYRNITLPFCAYWETPNYDYDYDEYEHELNLTN